MTDYQRKGLHGLNKLWIELVNMIAGGTSNRHFSASITYLTRH